MKELFKKIFNTVINNLHIVIAAFLLLYTIIPVLSPILFKVGLDRYGWWIQTVYRLFCHQRPERSIFLFGDKLTYSLEELNANGYNSQLLGYRFIGNSHIGYKIAFCTRDLFIYSTMALSGFLVAALKKQIKLKWWVFVLLIIPMILDGSIQFISEFLYLTQESTSITLAEPFYLSNNLTRAITGSLFGLGVGLLIHSELKKAVKEI
jgi:uncharacterized membrane protein